LTASKTSGTIYNREELKIQVIIIHQKQKDFTRAFIRKIYKLIKAIINMKKSVIIIPLLVIILIASYFVFFYTKNCKTETCFNTALSKCNKAKYINDAKDAAWLYKIKGKKGDECKIYVKLLQLKEGSSDIAGLEGKSMECSLPLGAIKAPQENLARCHGLLKEEMQTVIIKRLHSYIAENLGQIGSELQRAL